jgi:hypothetical protein
LKKRIVLVTLFILIVFALFNSTVKEETITTIADDVAMSVSVNIYGKDKETIISDSFEFEEGDTAFDALKAVTRKNKIQMETKGLSDMVYISGVNNLYELDEGPQSGWLYKVNGEMPEVGVNSYKLKNEDNIELIYILDFGKEFGS